MPVNPKQLDAHTEFDQKFLKIVDEHGWHVMNVTNIRKLSSSMRTLNFATA